jgi:hypothetical protein
MFEYRAATQHRGKARHPKGWRAFACGPTACWGVTYWPPGLTGGLGYFTGWSDPNISNRAIKTPIGRFPLLSSARNEARSALSSTRA